MNSSQDNHSTIDWRTRYRIAACAILGALAYIALVMGLVWLALSLGAGAYPLLASDGVDHFSGLFLLIFVAKDIAA